MLASCFVQAAAGLRAVLEAAQEVEQELEQEVLALDDELGQKRGLVLVAVREATVHARAAEHEAAHLRQQSVELQAQIQLVCVDAHVYASAVHVRVVVGVRSGKWPDACPSLPLPPSIPIAAITARLCWMEQEEEANARLVSDREQQEQEWARARGALELQLQKERELVAECEEALRQERTRASHAQTERMEVEQLMWQLRGQADAAQQAFEVADRDKQLARQQMAECTRQMGQINERGSEMRATIAAQERELEAQAKLLALVRIRVPKCLKSQPPPFALDLLPPVLSHLLSRPPSP